MPTSENTVAEESDLFNSVRLGRYELANRIVMAPLTRSRAQKGDVPSELAPEYYAQRASAGLIISEASQISPQGKGYAYTPGIYSREQVKAWKKVTDAVHAKNGRIFLQLWHVGRISHPSLQQNGVLPVAPSAIRPEGKAFTENGFQPFVTPRELELDEIADVVTQFERGAKYAMDAAFDGVEIHAANGYLIDQFLRDKTNHRSDDYGGSIQNRARFLLEVTNAVVGVWGADRVGVRIAPTSSINDIADSDPKSLFSYVVKALNEYNLAYLHMVEGELWVGKSAIDFDPESLRKMFNGTYIANNSYDLNVANRARKNNTADLISFGKLFISNPDLVERLKKNAPLNQLDQSTFYGGGEKGYTDYPFLEELVGQIP